MPEPTHIERATMQKLLWRDEEPETVGSPISVQFNPESLKLSFSNQVSGREQTGGASLQYVGKGTSRLSLELWFDATAADNAAGGDSRFLAENEADADVRNLTLQVLGFIKADQEREPGKFIPPGVRFLWGTFKFEGVVESINETLEFFSEEGRPLRASVSLTIAQQDIYLERQTPGSGASPPNSSSTGNANPNQNPTSAANPGASPNATAARYASPGPAGLTEGPDSPRQPGLSIAS